jgi:gliding motility-associated-like protein
MKNKLLLFVSFLVFASSANFAQKKTLPPDTSHFNFSYWNALADKYHYTPSEREEWLKGQKNIYVQEQLHEHEDVNFDSLVWINHDSRQIGGGNSITAGPCTNIDFEAGTMAGWVRSTGFNPLTNVTGCCPTANGDQTIMNGGVDPYGNFPRVWPGGGNNSLRLGSTAIGGRADRISQTFFVTPANANFTYRYAVVLNDPGHTLAQQPRFTSEILDTLGNQVPCTVFTVAASAGVPGFVNSTLTANGSVVRYKTWTDVAVDLTPNIGKNVTIQFTVYDCSPTGHFAYAYIDGFCTNFDTNVADTTCANVPINICAPTGFSLTTWNGPGVVNNPNRCINIVQPGTYSCTTLLVPGCPGPTFVHTLTLLPSPVISFTPVSSGLCSRQFTFNGALNISSGSIVSYRWFFGDGTTSTGPLNQVHTYANSGTYQVKLRAVSNRGCADSLIIPVTIAPTPVIAFSPPSNCINTVTQFTNLTTLALGAVTGYTWNLGNGVTSNLTNPAFTYTTSGTFTITLNAISDQGCTATLIQTLGIFPPPIISFSANPLCDANGTAFSPATSTAIASGSLASFFWDFGDGNTSTQASPVHVYAAPGLYTVNFSAFSNHNCPASTSNTFIISPSPTMGISTTSVNACSPNFTFTSNSSISAGSISHIWNLGGGVTSTLNSLTHVFPGIGNYTVSLIGTSNLGCGDTVLQYITIYPYPIVNFSVPASCENAIFTVTTTAVSGSVTSYLWDFGDPGSGSANTSTLQNPTHFYGATNPYTITLNLISNLNCPSTTVVPIVVFPNPNAIFSYTRANACSLPYTFANNSTVSAIGASSIVANNWNFGAAGNTTLANPGTVNFPSNGSYSVSLIVTTNHNCADTMSMTIDVHPQPFLSFTMIPECVGEPIPVVTSASISPVPSATSSINAYAWNFGNGLTSTLALPPPVTYSSSGVFTISLGATSDMGCTATLTNTLQVHANPVIDFTLVGSPCFGLNTNFTSTTSLSTGTILSYAWDFGDGTTGLGPNIVHTYSASGTYPVNYSVTTNFECMTVATKTVVIYPPANVSFSVNGGCLNTVSQFANTSSISVGNIALFTWNFGNGITSNAVNPSFTYTVPGTYSPTLTAFSDQGCVSSLVNTLVIDPLPNVMFNAAAACVNSPIQTVNSSSIAPGSITSYTWNFADGNTTVAFNPVHTFSNSGTFVVTLTAISSQSCVNSSTRNFTIHPFPNIAFFPLNNACTSNTVQIQPIISVTGTNNPINGYTLTFGDGSPAFTSTLTGTTISHVYTTHSTFSIGVSANSNGCIASSATSVVVYPRPVPNFTSNGFCHQSPTAFVNTSSIAATYSIGAYNWVFGNAGATSTLTNPNYVFTSPGVYSVNLTAFSFPEPGLTCSLSSVKTITINPLAGSSFLSNTVCAGNPTTFSNTTNPSGVIGWNWFFYNLSQTQSNLPNPAFTYSAAGTYTAYLVAQTLLGCRDTVSNIVTVNPNPITSFVADSVCMGNATTFSATSVILPNGSISAHAWNFGGGQTATGPVAAFTFSNAGVQSVSLTSTSNLGCSTRTVAPVFVNHIPNVLFNVNNVCLGDTSRFVNLSNITSGSITAYGWSFGNGTFSIQKDPIITYANSGVYTVKLEAFSDKQCSSSQTKTVAVYNVPNANFIIPKSICFSEIIPLTNVSTSSDGTITGYFWDFNNDGVTDNTNANPNTSFSVLGPGIVKLSVRSQYQCINTKTVSIFVNARPTPAFSSENKEGCPTLCVDFKNLSSISLGSITTWQWNFGDGTSLSTAANPKHCYNSGSYNVTLTAISDSGCVNRVVQPNFVNVFNLPVSSFNVQPEELDEEQPVIFVSSNASDAKLTKYFINDGSTYTKENFEHSFESLGKSYPMIVQVVISSNGCSDTSFKTLKIKPAFSMYFPNVFTPNDDGLNDTYQPKGVGIKEFNLWIYDRWGHLVFESDNIYNQWDGHMRGSAEPIKQDVYIWKAKVLDVFDETHEYVGHVSLIK